MTRGEYGSVESKVCARQIRTTGGTAGRLPEATRNRRIGLEISYSYPGEPIFPTRVNVAEVWPHLGRKHLAVIPAVAIIARSLNGGDHPQAPARRVRAHTPVIALAPLAHPVGESADQGREPLELYA